MQTNSSDTHQNSVMRTKRTSTGHRIEVGIPIPPRKAFWEGGGRKASLSFAGMSIGDSVLIPARTAAAMSRARSNVNNAAKRAGMQVTTRSTDEGLRVWRVA